MQSTRPNIVFVFSDQQRRQALGFMGEDPVLTPRLDAFAQESAWYRNALAHCPICTPNRAVMLTGMYPGSTKVLANNDFIDPEHPTIGNFLQSAGYHTGYIGKWHISPGNRGFVERKHRTGFDFWHAHNVNHNTFECTYYEEDETPAYEGMGWQPFHETDVAVDYIRKFASKVQPFALFLSYVPPHNTHGKGFDRHPEPDFNPGYVRAMQSAGYPTELQFRAPEKYEKPYQRKDLPRRANVPGNFANESLKGYFGACTGLDDQFGRILDAIDEMELKENTIVVYTSDHGEMLGSHRMVQKSLWYEESVGVPFIIRWPNQIKQGALDSLFSSLDIVPTLLGLAGINCMDLEGTNFSAELLGWNSNPPEEAFLAYYDMSREKLQKRQQGLALGWRAIRTKTHSYVIRRRETTDEIVRLLYDLQADPYQLNPVRIENGKNAYPLESRLVDFLKAQKDDFYSLLKT